MALRDFWSFDGLPAISGSTTPTTVLPFLRPDLAVVNVRATTTVSVASGALSCSSTGPTGVAGMGVSIPYQNVSNFATRRSFLGARIAWSASIGTSQGLTYFSIMWLTNTANTVQSLIPFTFVSTSSGSAYYEVMFDRLNKLVVVWADGVQISSTSFDFNAFTPDGNAVLSIGSYYSSSSYTPTLSATVRDVYFVDDTQDATQCNRLGPVDVRLAPLVAATAPNWTSSDSSTPLLDLSTVLGTTTATQTLPAIQSPSSRDVVTLGFGNTGLVSSETIVGFKADVSAVRNPGYAFGPATNLSYNGQNLAGAQLAYPAGNVMVFNQNAVLTEKAPDGSIWTPASIAAASFSLTP